MSKFVTPDPHIHKVRAITCPAFSLGLPKPRDLLVSYGNRGDDRRTVDEGSSTLSRESW